MVWSLLQRARVALVQSSRWCAVSSLLVLLCCALPGLAAPREYSYLDTRALRAARQKAVEGDPQVVSAVRAVVRDAEGLLPRPIPAVTEKNVLPPSGDAHDYYSLSPYWWPDSSKPDGLPYIRRDGRVNPERETIHDRENLRRVYHGVETFALAYALTDSERYASAAVHLLRRWFLDPSTRMNPGLTHAQIVRGNTKPRGAGIIEGRGMIILASSLELLAPSRHFTTSDREGMRDWFRAYLRWLNESPQGQDEIDAPNNHGSWYDAQRATIAWALGDTATVRSIVSAASSLRIASQIEPDGRMPKELQRTRALHYSTFNLMALFALATVAERVGVDLWTFSTADGRSLRKALDWVLPYASGRERWPYDQISPYDPDFCYELLLRAAIVYREPAYRRQAEELGGIDRKTHRGILLHQEAP